MNYYEEMLREIKNLFDDGNVTQALQRVNQELSMPYIPREIEEQLVLLKKDLELYEKEQKTNDKISLFTLTKLEELLFSDNIEDQIVAVRQLGEYALEKYLPIVEKYFEKPNNEDVVSLLLYLLIEKQVNKEIHVVRKGLEITCIPKYCELPEESDGYELGMEYLQEHIVQNPSALELAYQELHMRLLDYLPLSYEEDEVEYLCQDIIRTIFDSLDEHDEWEKLSKRYGW